MARPRTPIVLLAAGLVLFNGAVSIILRTSIDIDMSKGPGDCGKYKTLCNVTGNQDNCNFDFVYGGGQGRCGYNGKNACPFKNFGANVTCYFGTPGDYSACPRAQCPGPITADDWIFFAAFVLSCIGLGFFCFSLSALGNGRRNVSNVRLDLMQ